MKKYLLYVSDYDGLDGGLETYHKIFDSLKEAQTAMQNQFEICRKCYESSEPDELDEGEMVCRYVNMFEEKDKQWEILEL